MIVFFFLIIQNSMRKNVFYWKYNRRGRRYVESNFHKKCGKTVIIEKSVGSTLKYMKNIRQYEHILYNNIVFLKIR